MEGSVGLAVSKPVMREIDSRPRSGYLVGALAHQRVLVLGYSFGTRFWVKGDAACGSYTSDVLKPSIILVQGSGLEW